MQFTNGLIVSLFLAAVSAAPAATKRESIDPSHPHITTEQQCTYTNVVGRSVFNVVINNAKAFTNDECGSGFLDNLHGQGCDVSSWGCNYAEDGTTMNANFSTDLLHCTGEKVGNAIYAAFGHLTGVTCKTDDPSWNLPPSKKN